MPQRIDYFKVRGTAYYVYKDGLKLSLDVETVIEADLVDVELAQFIINGQSLTFNEVAVGGLLEEGVKRTPFLVEHIHASITSVSLLEVS